MERVLFQSKKQKQHSMHRRLLTAQRQLRTRERLSEQEQPHTKNKRSERKKSTQRDYDSNSSGLSNKWGKESNTMQIRTNNQHKRTMGAKILVEHQDQTYLALVVICTSATLARSNVTLNGNKVGASKYVQ